MRPFLLLLTRCFLDTRNTRSQVPELEWGAGAGCDFLTASCREFADKNPAQDLYCPPGYEGGEARSWGEES